MNFKNYTACLFNSYMKSSLAIGLSWDYFGNILVQRSPRNSLRYEGFVKVVKF